MRKQTKLVAVLSAAALLAIGASMTSFAATGWAEEDGTWVYYDKDGNKASNEWKKSGTNWFYLDSDGEMATDVIIEDGDNYYFVDANGAMAANQWVQVENVDDTDEDAPTSFWYYFQANGKAYKAATTGKTSFKTINSKKYAFTDEGKMLFGWVDDLSLRQTGDESWREGTYFCGDENDGAMATGWAQISVIDTLNEDSEDQDYWFYFDTATGKKVQATTTTFKEKTINGAKYTFDSYGTMQSEWTGISMASPAIASDVNSYKYYNDAENGARVKGWFKVVPQEDVNPTDNADESAKWYYGDSTAKLAKSTIKSINNKKYAFNNKGEMLNGIQIMKVSGSTILGNYKLDDEDKITASKDVAGNKTFTLYDGTTQNYSGVNVTDVHVYYFGGGEDGSMKLGNQNIVVDGETYTYSFVKSGTDKGQGLTGVKDGVVYRMGQKITADSDLRYQVVNTATGAKLTSTEVVSGIYNNAGYVLINTSGSIMKSKKNLKDTDDMYYCTTALGYITGYSAQKCGTTVGSVSYKCTAHN